LVRKVYTVSATSVLDFSAFCVHELTVYCCFIFCCCFSFLLPRSICFFYRDDPPRMFFSIICSRPAPWRISSPSWNASGQLVKLCTQQCAWLLKRLVFAEVGDLTSWHKTKNCYRATIVCLDAKGLWKLGQSFILAGFTLSLPCSAPCGTEQIMIDTGCDPALPRNFVDHPADCNPNNLIKFAIIRPSTLNHDRNLWNCRGSPNETTSLTVFVSVSQRLSFNLHEIV